MNMEIRGVYDFKIGVRDFFYFDVLLDLFIDFISTLTSFKDIYKGMGQTIVNRNLFYLLFIH